MQDIQHCKNPVHFKTAFKIEEIKMNNFTTCLELYQEKCDFIMPDNDTTQGRFFKYEHIVFERNDKNVLEFNVSKLNKLASDV